MRNLLLLCGAAFALALTGCTTLPTALNGVMTNSADRYEQAQAQQAVSVRLGTVIDVRHVEIAATGTQRGVGSGVGAAIGALAGHLVGNGNGKVAAEVVGAVGGGIAGNKIAANAYQQPGLAIAVKLDNGQAIQITQAADVPLEVGQRVLVTGDRYGRTPMRVVPLKTGVMR